ncbi:MAG: Hsp20/alpha crystallin family protein [Lachnospiraceae bacterium]|nr:Hsp20/alpha crystallin family protein [Lachnospiraceae bacterium]
MYAPSIFEDRFMNNFLDDFFGKPVSALNRMANPMRTDIMEKDGNYYMSIDMPGYKKEDLKAELKDGYLTISAGSREEKEEKDETGKLIYRERHTGECRRSYFVGKHLNENDIKASFENGVLKLEFPSEEKKPAEEQKKVIAIQ